MIWISFGKWSTSSGPMFIWYRVYWNYKWTPLIWSKPRYNMQLNADDKNQTKREAAARMDVFSKNANATLGTPKAESLFTSDGR